MLKLLKTGILLLFVTISLAACSNNPAQSVAEKYVHAMLAGDVETVIPLIANMPTDEKEREYAKGKLGVMLQAMKEGVDKKGGLDKVEFEEMQYNEDKTTATVQFTMYFKDKTSEKDTLKLIKTPSGEWKIK